MHRKGYCRVDSGRRLSRKPKEFRRWQSRHLPRRGIVPLRLGRKAATWRLTIRLSDARLRRRQTELVYPNHRPTPWLIEDVASRSLEPIVRRYARDFSTQPILNTYRDPPTTRVTE